MAARLLPVVKTRFFDANGAPLAGGKVYSYAAGTNTPQATYTDESGLTPNANPTILDSEGYANIWLNSNFYKMVIADSNDVVLFTTDNVNVETTAGADGATIYNGSGAPSNGLGSDGDYYLDTASANKDFYYKSGGTYSIVCTLTGPTGAAGTNGTNGTNGYSVLNGSGAPGGGVGVDNDFYYDPAAKIMYGPKASGVWPAGISLDGGGGAVVNSASSNVTLSSSSPNVQYIPCDATSAAFNVTLPLALVGIVGQIFQIKKIDSSGNAVTILRNGSDQILGTSLVTSLSLDYQGKSFSIICRAAGFWDII